MISLALERFEMYRKPPTTSFTLKKSRSKAMMGTPKPLSLKTTCSPTRTPRNLEKVGMDRR